MHNDIANIGVVYTNYRAFETYMQRICEESGIVTVSRGVKTTTITTQWEPGVRTVWTYCHIYLRSGSDRRTAEEASAGRNFKGFHYIVGNYSSDVINYLQSRIRVETEVVRRCLI